MPAGRHRRPGDISAGRHEGHPAIFNGTPVGIQLPARVTLEVIETEPAMKGQTASSSFKPAKLVERRARHGAAAHLGRHARRHPDRRRQLRRARQGLTASRAYRPLHRPSDGSPPPLCGEDERAANGRLQSSLAAKRRGKGDRASARWRGRSVMERIRNVRLLAGRLLQVPPELETHRREQLVLVVRVAARKKPLVEGGAQDRHRHAFVDRRLDRPTAFA